MSKSGSPVRSGSAKQAGRVSELPTCVLYDYLLAVTKDRVSRLDSSSLIVCFSRLKPVHAKVVHALILHHEALRGRAMATPCQSLLVGKDKLQYDFNKFDEKLQAILRAYVEEARQQ